MWNRTYTKECPTGLWGKVVRSLWGQDQNLSGVPAVPLSLCSCDWLHHEDWYRRRNGTQWTLRTQLRNLDICCWSCSPVSQPHTNAGENHPSGTSIGRRRCLQQRQKQDHENTACKQLPSHCRIAPWRDWHLHLFRKWGWTHSWTENVVRRTGKARTEFLVPKKVWS